MNSRVKGWIRSDVLQVSFGIIQLRTWSRDAAEHELCIPFGLLRKRRTFSFRISLPISWTQYPPVTLSHPRWVISLFICFFWFLMKLANHWRVLVTHRLTFRARPCAIVSPLVVNATRYLSTQCVWVAIRGICIVCSVSISLCMWMRKCANTLTV